MAKLDSNEFKKEFNEVRRTDQNFVRIFISITVFSIISLVLSFDVFRINPSFLPKFISIDFSVFAELIASIAFGPIIGVAVCLIKSVVRAFINYTALYSIIANFFVNSTFVAIAGTYYYFNVMPRKRAKRKAHVEVHRRKIILKGSLIGMIPAVILQYILTNKFVFPKFNWYYGKQGYTYEGILAFYKKSADIVSSHMPGFLGRMYDNASEIWQYTLLFNVPVTIFKFLTVTLVVALIYPYISPYIHFRKKG